VSPIARVVKNAPSESRLFLKSSYSILKNDKPYNEELNLIY